jgi:DNA-binding NarL/FixJ family response regulator
MIRVVVVDDHPLFAQGTVEILDRLPGIRAVGFATSLDEAVAQIREVRPDVVVCDVMLGDTPNGFDLIARLGAAGGDQPPIIYLSQFANAVLYQRAIAAGAAGYLSKTVEPEALRAAVLAVASGSTVFPRAAISPQADGPRIPSPRELEILAMVADGRSNTEIGARLGIGESTVETHISRLRVRYGLATRTQLALLADRQGWLTPRPEFEATS